MGTDQIRRETLRLELLSSTGTALGTDDLGFRFHRQGMNPWSVAAIEAVAVVIKALRHATPAIQRIYPQGHQLMLALLGQPLNDVNVLTRKVLMNEKDPH